MSQSIQKNLQRIAGSIHFFGKYGESDLLLRISIYLKLMDINTEEQLDEVILNLMPAEKIE